MPSPIGTAHPRAKILSNTPENIQRVAQAILDGDVVGMPTETVYGLAGNARSPLALAKIFATKERPTFDPLILHVGPMAKSIGALEAYQLIDRTQLTATQVGEANQLMQEFWPGPLTLVLPKHKDIPDLATSGLPTVALRMPQHPVALALIATCQCPLAAPSANRFGRISPTSPKAVEEELGDRISWILDGGHCQIGVESTILGLNEAGDWVVFRPGGTPIEKIEKVLNRSVAFQSGTLVAPGMLESHYAPVKPLKLLPKRIQEMTASEFETLKKDLENLSSQASIGLLLQSGDPDAGAKHFSQATGFSVISRSLSLNGDLTEMAHSLFSEMRALDASPAEIIYAEFSFSNQGLGFAISDRLRRASAKRPLF
jgi:L-threonylcarbamoyladenylate synthase